MCRVFITMPPGKRSPNLRARLRRPVTKNARASAVRRRTLLPVLRPTQNLRDIIKQLALLEDHLYQPQKRCADCIRKHFLTIEALAEECATLCKPRSILPESRKVATQVRIMHHAWEQRRKDPTVAEHIAGKLRRLRKGLMKRFAALPLNKLPTAETNAVNGLLTAIRASQTIRASPQRSTPRRASRASPQRSMPRRARQTIRTPRRGYLSVR